MKTLLLYFAENKKAIKLCEDSRTLSGIDVLAINERYYRSFLAKKSLGCLQAKKGSAVRIDMDETELDSYDTIILATELWGGNPPPAVNEFLRKTGLNGKEIIGLFLNKNKPRTSSADTLKKRISLAGGFCRSIVNVPVKQLAKSNEDVFSFANEKLCLR